MSTSETRYSFRARVPVTLHRGRAQDTAISAYIDGNPVTIGPGATYTLLDRTGAVLVNAATATVSGGIATYSLSVVDLPDTLALGAGYQERWVLDMPDGTTRTVRRTAAVALFELHPPVVDDDLLRVYPDLLDSLGDYASSLQGWIDDAWDKVVRKLWKHGRFPHIVVEPSDVYEWARELAFATIFRALFKASRGEDERWRILWEDHKEQARAAEEGAAITVDEDGDGLADHVGKEPAVASTARWNAPYTSDPRHLPKAFR